MNLLKKKNEIYNYFALSLFSLTLFFWDIQIFFIEIKFLYLILIFPILFKEIKEIKNILNKQFFLFLIINFFLFGHFFLLHLFKIKVGFYSFGSLVVVSMTILIVYKYINLIIDGFNYILDFFLFLFLLSCIFSYSGVIQITQELETLGCSYQSGIFTSKSNLISNDFKFFLENSHLSMIAIGVIFYNLFKIDFFKLNKLDIFRLILIFIFLIISLHNFSLVFFTGITISLISVILISYNKKFTIHYMIIIFVSIFSYYNIFIQDKSCETKLSDIKEYVFGEKEIIQQDLKPSLSTSFNKKEEAPIKYKYSNLSMAVYIQSLDITLFSLTKYPFGVGLNNYEFSYEKFLPLSRKDHYLLDGGSKFNYKDGSNNLFKSLTEIGIFSLFLGFLILYLAFSRKIPIELKYFIIPNLLIQTFLRGAGYFNGGYVFLIILIISIYIKNYND